MKKIILALLLSATLFGCGPKLKHGEIIDKRHEPESTFVMFFPMFISNGKTTTTIMIPYVVRDDEDFVLLVRGDHDDELIEEAWYVTEDVYNKSEIGGHVGFDAELATRDDKHEKVKRA